MPELPETETIARDLDAALTGTVVKGVRVLRRDVLRGPLRGLDGARIVRVHRRAKSIVLTFEPERALVVTPRFTGALLIGAAPDPYTCVELSLADGRTLLYRDVRRLGTVALMNHSAFELWNRTLGAEPLDPALTSERFSGILRGSSRTVKAVLMDQKKLAGVGNIYANEALWRAQILPRRTARRVSETESATLLRQLRSVLAESIALRGTTFRDYKDAYGNRGEFAAKLDVYGRGSEPCHRCGTALRETHVIERRSTVWCPRCQQ